MLASAMATCTRRRLSRHDTEKHSTSCRNWLCDWRRCCSLEKQKYDNQEEERERMSEKQWYVPLSKVAGPISPLKRCTQNTKRHASKQRWPHSGSLEHRIILTVPTRKEKTKTNSWDENYVFKWKIRVDFGRGGGGGKGREGGGGEKKKKWWGRGKERKG